MTNNRYDPNNPQPPDLEPDAGLPSAGCRSAGEAAGSPLRDSPAVSNDELLRFVDGALDDDGRVRVLTRLAGRPATVERVEAYLHQNARLRSLREHLPLDDSADFAAPLQAALVASLRQRHARRNWQRFGAAAALALAVAAGAIGLAVDPWRSPSPAPDKSASTVAQAYFLFDKPELGSLAPAVAETAPTADDTALQWLAAQLSDFSISSPDFARIGLELVGGETLERQGKPAIRLVYRDQAAKPVVFDVGIGKPDADHAFWLAREGYVSLQWRRGPMVFAVVAPTDSPQLSQVVDIVGSAVARLPAPDAVQAPAQPENTNAAAAESGPVQAIAAPLTPATSGTSEPAETSSQPPAEAVLQTQDDHRPEPL